MHSECCICYESWGKCNNPMKLHPCAHTVCSVCVKNIVRCPLCRHKIERSDFDDLEAYADIACTLPCGAEVTIGTRRKLHVCERQQEKDVINDIPVAAGTDICDSALLLAVQSNCTHSLNPFLPNSADLMDEMINMAVLHKAYKSLALLYTVENRKINTKINARLLEETCMVEERTVLLAMIFQAEHNLKLKQEIETLRQEITGLRAQRNGTAWYSDNVPNDQLQLHGASYQASETWNNTISQDLYNYNNLVDDWDVE